MSERDAAAEPPEPPANVSLVRPRMYHTDSLGGLYHGRVFELFEEARTEVFRRLGFAYREVEEAGLAMIAVKVGARFDEVVRLGVYVERLKRAQIRIGNEGRRDGDGALLFAGFTIFAFAKRATGRPVRVPASIVDAARSCPGMVREAMRPGVD